MWFRSDGLQARLDLIHDAEWEVEDNRALLFVKRRLVLVDLAKVGAIIFPNREATGPHSPHTQSEKLRKQGANGCDREDDHDLYSLRIGGVEEFDGLSLTEYDGRFSALELELALVIAIFYGTAWTDTERIVADFRSGQAGSSDSG